jgi:hypothetical protein
MTSNRVVNSSSAGSRIFILFVGVGDDDENELLIRRRRRRLMLDDELLSLFILSVMEATGVYRRDSGLVWSSPFVFLKRQAAL